MAETTYTTPSTVATTWEIPRPLITGGTPIGLLLALTQSTTTGTSIAATWSTPPAIQATTYQNPTQDIGFLLLDDTYYLLIDATSKFIISAAAV